MSKCDDFLRSPHGHAALLAGSLVTRLARDIVSFDDVYNGPTENIFETGFYLYREDTPFGLWDDCLTEDELDLICGVYRIDTGKLI